MGGDGEDQRGLRGNWECPGVFFRLVRLWWTQVIKGGRRENNRWNNISILSLRRTPDQVRGRRRELKILDSGWSLSRSWRGPNDKKGKFPKYYQSIISNPRRMMILSCISHRASCIGPGIRVNRPTSPIVHEWRQKRITVSRFSYGLQNVPWSSEGLWPIEKEGAGNWWSPGSIW